jgi:hypothetical protein
MSKVYQEMYGATSKVGNQCNGKLPKVTIIFIAVR